MDKVEANQEVPKNCTSKISIISHATNVVHIITIVLSVYFLYLSLCDNLDFFMWHPILLTVGWILLMTEGIAALNKDNSILIGWLGKNRTLIHWVLQVLAVALIAGGFAVVVIYKNDRNEPHFKTWHAIFGLVGIIFAFVCSFMGIFTLFNRELKNYYSPKLNKFIHIILGTLAYIFGGISAVLSVYTGWFKWKTSDEYSVFIISLILCAIIVLWTLIKPIKSTLDRFVSLITT